MATGPGDKELKKFDWPLNGRLITSIEPMLLPDGHFSVLKNMRPKESNPEGVSGMTKINTAANVFDYLSVHNGFHFSKDDITENHVFVQTTSGSNSKIKKSDNTASIPSQDSFTDWLTLTANNRCFFSPAPDSSMMIMNGKKNYIWGGSEARCARFLTSSAAVTTTITNPIDYTDKINNSLTDGQNVAIIGGGNDAYAVALLHGDGTDGSTTITNSAAGGTGNFTAAGNAQVDTAQAKFGTGSLRFDGAGDYVYYADDADWNYGTGALTLDFWVRFSSLTGQHCLYSQSSTTTHIVLYFDNTAQKLVFSVMSAGTRILHESATWSPSASTWYHVAVVRGWGGVANDWAFTVDGVVIHTFTNAGTLPDSGAQLWIGLHPTSVPIDCGATGHALTQVGTAAISASQYKFANGSIYITGGGNYFTIADHADFDLGANDFTIEAFVRCASYPGAGSDDEIIGQWSTGGQYAWMFSIHNTGGTLNLRLTYTTTGAVGDLTAAERPMSATATDTWYHIAMKRDGNNLTFWQDGAQLGTAVDLTGVTIWNSTATVEIGGSAVGDSFDGYIDEIRLSNVARTITVPTAPYASDANTKLLLHCDYIALNGWLDEYRASKGLARWTAAFTPWTRAYTTAALTWLVGAIRPIRGIKVYVGDANSTANTLSAKEWNGYSWNTLTITADGTRNVGDTASLTKTGSITFASTETTSEPRMINENFAYWYQFAVTAGEATIYRCTIDMAPQAVVDIWDGTYRPCYSFFKFTTAYTDYSVNTYESDYISTDSLYYAQVGGLAAFSSPNNCLFVGFLERMTGIRAILPDDSYQNTTAATTMAVDYWNGYEWVSVGDIVDGTSTGAVSFTQTGTVTWNQLAENSEHKTTIGNGSEFYYYRIRFDKTLTNGGNDVRVDSVFGIPAQIQIRPRRFALNWQNRLWLFDEVDGRRNTGICSAYDTTCVFNGSDTTTLSFSGPSAVVAGAPLFTRYGGNIYENLIVCKRNETFLVDGTSPSDYFVYKIAPNVGCMSPLTLRVCDLGYEIAPGLNKHVLIWLSSDGVILFDANTLINISGDISDRFDPNDSNYLNMTYSQEFFGFYDAKRCEYHLLVATGSSTSLNEEWVYNILLKKWFLVDRGATKRLKSGWECVDTNGDRHIYGGTGDGYVERLEYGTTFDGTAIAQAFKTNAAMPLKTAVYETNLRYVQLIGKAKTTTTQTVTVTHYADGDTTGNASIFAAMSMAASGKRFFRAMRSGIAKGITHELQFAVSTTDETVGFEPYLVSGFFQQERQVLQ